MGRRRAVWVMGGILLLAGCAPTPPGPSPEPSVVFMTDDEAFAAAEATYRAYVDALNQYWSNDKRDAVTDYLTGAALADELAGRELLAASRQDVTGRAELSGMSDVRRVGTRISALLCLDTSATRLVNEFGEDITPTQRSTRTQLAVEFVVMNDHLLIVRSDSTGTPC